MVRKSLLLAAFAWLLCAACATAPKQSEDVEYYAPKVYRTGSNIAVKDYGAENIEFFTPQIVDQANHQVRCIPGAKTVC
jgi:hypothetical protein